MGQKRASSFVDKWLKIKVLQEHQAVKCDAFISGNSIIIAYMLLHSIAGAICICADELPIITAAMRC